VRTVDSSMGSEQAIAVIVREAMKMRRYDVAFMDLFFCLVKVAELKKPALQEIAH